MWVPAFMQSATMMAIEPRSNDADFKQSSLVFFREKKKTQSSLKSTLSYVADCEKAET